MQKICITETHLKYDNVTDVPDFTSYVNNGEVINPHTRKGSGGVALLIKDPELDNFTCINTMGNCDSLHYYWT